MSFNTGESINLRGFFCFCSHNLILLDKWTLKAYGGLFVRETFFFINERAMKAFS